MLELLRNVDSAAYGPLGAECPFWGVVVVLGVFGGPGGVVEGKEGKAAPWEGASCVAAEDPHLTKVCLPACKHPGFRLLKLRGCQRHEGGRAGIRRADFGGAAAV